jgi:menaquinone reductase, multiheme cytochrome c subunit
MQPFVFPRWSNKLVHVAGAVLGIAPLYVIGLVWYGASPKTTDVGYAPKQPVPYSHALHAGELGIDCKYCHTTVDKASFAAIPPTETCMNCHQRIHVQSPKLAPIRASFASGEPVAWTKVHDLPDYAYFNHSAHIAKGVGCVSCHGRVDTMEVVTQRETLSMGWCLDCHREPELALRPAEEVTNMAYEPPPGLTQLARGKELRSEHNINPPTDCSTCHR